MIIVEGADNSGKTTLARSLTSLPYFSAGPAPKDDEELGKCLAEQMVRATTPCVQDRLTCISQRVYWDSAPVPLLRSYLQAFLETPRCVIVYCRPPERTLMDLSTHKVKSYDTEENLQKIVQMQHEFVSRYDEVMKDVPCVRYDWTDYDESDNKNLRSMLVATQYSDDEWRKFMELIRSKWVPGGSHE